MPMEKRWVLLGFVLIVLLPLLSAQGDTGALSPEGPATVGNPVSDPEDYIEVLESVGDEDQGLVSSMIDKVKDFISPVSSRVMLPLPGEPIMHSQLCTPTPATISNLYRISFLAAAAGLMFIAFMYVLGKAFETKKWVDYAKNELFEMTLTIIVVLLIMVPLLMIMGCVNPFQPGVSIYQAAFAYPKDIISSVTMTSVIIYWINAFLQNVLQVKVVQNIFAGFSGSLGVGGDDPSFGSLSQAGMILVMVTGLASLMAYIHELVTYGFIAYLLPVGIVMRLFAPTRRIGGTIIGLVFGMAILMPFLMAIGHSVIAVNYFPLYYNIAEKRIDSQHDLIPRIKSFVVELITLDAVTYAEGDLHFTEGTSINEYGDPVENPELQSRNPGIFGFLMGMISGTLVKIMGMLMLITGSGVLCFGGTIYPLIVSIILISGVKYMSSVFGEEIDVSNLTRLV